MANGKNIFNYAVQRCRSNQLNFILLN